MKVLVFSDIHANLSALSAVIEAAGKVDAYWCLGDLVGYGPDPNECIELIKDLPNLVCILGNHDAAALDFIDIGIFNHDARRSAEWTKEQLSPSNKLFLSHLEDSYTNEIAMMVHGSPKNHIWEYLLDPYIAASNFEHFSTHLCFVGHTHIPACCYDSIINDVPQWQFLYENDKPNLETRAILNPGSVGQPRDRDPRASFAIFDSGSHVWEQRRVEYDVFSVQERIINSGLPTNHALRLLDGW